MGVNYTMFFEEKTDQTTLPGTRLSLDDSFGFAVEAGFDFALNENWGVGLEIWYVDIETEATISGAVNAKVDVQIDPIVYMAGLSYKF
ncbi:MAG: OmpW family outer membrane protein [Pseudomonadales bacterium]